MPALPPYIPAKLSDLALWSANFAALIVAAPTTYGLVAADATTISGVNSTFQTAYTASIGPATRTPTTVQTRIDATVALLATVRPYAQQVANNAGVSDANKIALGLNPRTTTPTKITTPATNPVLTIDQALTLQHVVRYRDQLASPTVKSKPYGVVQVQIFAMTSATAITDPAAIAYKTATTKSPVIISWDASEAGKKAYYTARWITRTGLVGPFAPIVSFTVAA
jgi:hypothetical protein